MLLQSTQLFYEWHQIFKTKLFYPLFTDTLLRLLGPLAPPFNCLRVIASPFLPICLSLDRCPLMGDPSPIIKLTEKFSQGVWRHWLQNSVTHYSLALSSTLCFMVFAILNLEFAIVRLSSWWSLKFGIEARPTFLGKTSNLNFWVWPQAPSSFTVNSMLPGIIYQLLSIVYIIIECDIIKSDMFPPNQKRNHH
jgi:hypothetical protein